MPEGKNLEWTFAYDATVDVLFIKKKIGFIWFCLLFNQRKVVSFLFNSTLLEIRFIGCQRSAYRT